MCRGSAAFRAMVLALAAFGAGPPQAQAAVHDWNIEELRIAPAEFQQHKQALNLDGMALDGAQGLYQQYERDFNDLRDVRKLALDWVQGHLLDCFGGMHARDDELLDAIVLGERAIIRAWNERSRDLGEKYFDDLSTILSVDRESVEALRRAHLRHRLRDLRSATSEPVAGVDCRIAEAMDRVRPAWRQDEGLRSMVIAYELALDPLLRRADESCWANGERKRAAWYEVRIAGERQRDAALDRFAKLIANHQESLVSIRRLNMQTVQQLVACLPQAESDALRAAVDPELRSYLFEHNNAAHARLKLIMRRRDLTPEQREALQAIGASLQAARAAAAPRLDGLHDRAITPELLSRSMRAALASRWTGVRAPEETSEEQEFREALEQWREMERAFNRQIAAAAGERWPFAESVDPTFIVEAVEQSEIGSDEWIQEMFGLAIGRAEMDAFIATVADGQPGLAQAIRERHAQLLAEYEFEASASLQHMREGVARINAMDRLLQQDDQVGEDMEQVMRQHHIDSRLWHRRRAELQRKMKSELEAMMNEPSVPAWNRFVDAQRRKQFLPPSDWNRSIVENPADLIRELDRLNLEPMERERLSALADGYASEIGALLLLYEDQQERTMEVAEALNEAREEEQRQAVLPRYEAAYQEQRNLMHRIDVATARHVEIIAGAMEPGAAAAFREAVQRHRWPRAFAVTPTAWAAERLLSEGLLEEAQRGAIEQMLASEVAALAPLRQQIIAAAEQWTRPGEAERRQAEHQALVEGGQQPWAAHEGHPAVDLLKRRMERERQDRAQLRGILSPERLHSCPPGVRLVLEVEH